MAYKVIILYRLYMPSYFLGTFTEYPFLCNKIRLADYSTISCKRVSPVFAFSHFTILSRLFESGTR